MKFRRMLRVNSIDSLIRTHFRHLRLRPRGDPWRSLYKNLQGLEAGRRLLVHDFMVDDSLDGPPLGALWALQHVTVNADGIGLCPFEGARARAL